MGRKRKKPIGKRNYILKNTQTKQNKNEKRKGKKERKKEKGNQ